MKYVAQAYREGKILNVAFGQITDEDAEKIRSYNVEDAHLKFIYYAYSDFDTPSFEAGWGKADETWGFEAEDVFDTFQEAKSAFFKQLFS